MNVAELPFDKEQMIAGLRLWVETESPGCDSDAVNKVIDLASYDFSTIGATVERIPGRMGYADSLRASFNPDGINKPGILICCHADTVHEIGSLSAMPYRREGDKLWGAGIAAMKAGMFIFLEALRQIVHANIKLNLPLTMLIVSDKESGCPATRELIEATAKSHQYALVASSVAEPESIIVGCDSEARYKLDVKVDTTAGEGYSSSAISEMAHHIVSIDQMSTVGYRYKVGSIRSGQWVNFSETCTAEVVSYAKTKKDVEESHNRMMALNSPNPDKGLHVNRSTSLPLWQTDASTNPLVSIATEVGQSLGLTLVPVVGCGGSVASIIAATGVATLDGLGAVGAGAQSRAERIEIDSLITRGQLMAGLLTTLG